MRGDDKFLFKWKPREHCTADFRLANGDFNAAKDEWTFDGCVLVGQPPLDEKPLEGSVVVVSGRLQKQELLSDGTIVECRVSPASARQQRSAALATGAAATSSSAPPTAVIVWEFLRTRPDKVTPNKHDIAVTIRDMEHMTLDEVRQECEKACAAGPSGRR